MCSRAKKLALKWPIIASNIRTFNFDRFPFEFLIIVYYALL